MAMCSLAKRLTGAPVLRCYRYRVVNTSSYHKVRQGRPSPSNAQSHKQRFKFLSSGLADNAERILQSSPDEFEFLYQALWYEQRRREATQFSKLPGCPQLPCRLTCIAKI